MSITAMMISSDSHIIKPPDLWTGRVPTGPMAERVPQVRREPGGDWWYIDGQRSMSFLGFQAGSGGRDPGRCARRRAADDPPRQLRHPLWLRPRPFRDRPPTPLT